MEQDEQRRASTGVPENLGPTSDQRHEPPSVEQLRAGVALDARAMTLDELDAAFQSGSIDATTLVCLQCSAGSVAGSSPKASASIEVQGELHAPPGELRAPARDPSPRALTASTRLGDDSAGPRDRARIRRGKIVRASAVGLALSAAAGVLSALPLGWRRTAEAEAAAAGADGRAVADSSDPSSSASSAPIGSEPRSDPPGEGPKPRLPEIAPAESPRPELGAANAEAVKPRRDVNTTRKPARKAQQRKTSQPASLVSKAARLKSRATPTKETAP
jgi:hypothetical protein